MKVLLINGSPRVNGNTAIALEEMVKVFKEENVETEVIQIGQQDIRGCIGCGFCYKNGHCVFNDIVDEVNKKLESCDGLVLASPVYYASPNGTLLSFLDRLFYSSRLDKRMMVGASIAVARRGGCSSTFDVLNKYFSISSMPIAPSTYWNMTHGFTPEDVQKDKEGLQTMRNLAKNMIFMMKAFKDAKEKYGLPEVETTSFTSFPDGK